MLLIDGWENLASQALAMAEDPDQRESIAGACDDVGVQVSRIVTAAARDFSGKSATGSSRDMGIDVPSKGAQEDFDRAGDELDSLARELRQLASDTSANGIERMAEILDAMREARSRFDAAGDRLEGKGTQSGHGAKAVSAHDLYA